MIENRLRIKEILREKGITVTEFAQKLGIERQNVYNVFLKPSWQRLEQCSAILNLPISELFEKEISEIQGFIEYKGAIYRINNLQSFNSLAELVNNDQNKETEE